MNEKIDYVDYMRLDIDFLRENELIDVIFFNNDYDCKLYDIAKDIGMKDMKFILDTKLGIVDIYDYHDMDIMETFVNEILMNDNCDAIDWFIRTHGKEIFLDTCHTYDLIDVDRLIEIRGK